MARKPMVTRTIVTTKATAMCLNIVTGEPSTETFTLPRTYTDEKKMLKAIEAMLPLAELKAVHIVASESVETLYGMSEQDFINHATILDPETRKMIESETDEQ